MLVRHNLQSAPIRGQWTSLGTLCRPMIWGPVRCHPKLLNFVTSPRNIDIILKWLEFTLHKSSKNRFKKKELLKENSTSCTPEIIGWETYPLQKYKRKWHQKEGISVKKNNIHSYSLSFDDKHYLKDRKNGLAQFTPEKQKKIFCLPWWSLYPLVCFLKFAALLVCYYLHGWR